MPARACVGSFTRLFNCPVEQWSVPFPKQWLPLPWSQEEMHTVANCSLVFSLLMDSLARVLPDGHCVCRWVGFFFHAPSAPLMTTTGRSFFIAAAAAALVSLLHLIHSAVVTVKLHPNGWPAIALVNDCGDALGKSVTQSILFAVFVGCARQNNCQGWQRYKLRLLMSAGYSIPEEVYSGCLRSWFLNWFVEFLWRTLGFIESKTKEEWNLKTWRLNSWIIPKAVDKQCCVVLR